MRPTAEQIIEAVQARGNDARGLRDAAHEAHHALEAKVPAGRWDRESIHRAVMRMGRGKAAASEVMARAVEQIVCADFGVDCGTVERWAFVACTEALKSGVAFPGVTWFADAVRGVMTTETARAAADSVIALAAKPLQKPARRKRAA